MLKLEKINEKINKQLNYHLDSDKLYGLTPFSQNNYFSNVFSYYILYFLEKDIHEKNEQTIELIIKKIKESLISQTRNIELNNTESKKFMQLFCFNCSALYSYDQKKYSDLIFRGLEKIFSYYKKKILIDKDTLFGKPGTGNFAMFKGIILTSLKFIFNYNNANNALDEWIDIHLQYMNPKTGLWSQKSQASLRGIQNSYHQYEIFEFLEDHNYVKIDWNPVSLSAYLCVDSNGNFAPYSGGSACYDYDAIFLLSKNKVLFNKFLNKYKKCNLIIKSVKKYENYMFQESLFKPNIMHRVNDVISSKNLTIMIERIKFNISILIYGEKLLKPHWCSDGNFSINKPDLWSIWFRYLTFLKIISSKENYSNQKRKGLNFPGIGYKI